MDNEMISDDELNGLSRRVLGAAYLVSNALGPYFKEKIYENALCHELRKQGMDAQQQVAPQVFYDEIVVGEFVCDILVNDVLLLELKAADAIHPEHQSQAISYLSATGLTL